jgi:hypothetical protein
VVGAAHVDDDLARDSRLGKVEQVHLDDELGVFRQPVTSVAGKVQLRQACARDEQGVPAGAKRDVALLEADLVLSP